METQMSSNGFRNFTLLKNYGSQQSADNSQHYFSTLNQTSHDGVLRSLSGRLKTLLQSAPCQTLIYFKIFTVFMLATLFSTSNSNLNAQTDTLICDNGGFESNFLYYNGYGATFDSEVMITIHNWEDFQLLGCQLLYRILEDLRLFLVELTH
ncbi:MAG: hypothetical protein IPH93_13610 [Saprospiraceae bacterium]|nr:hypothetical protein [Saprospiraceae bacterium]